MVVGRSTPTCATTPPPCRRLANADPEWLQRLLTRKVPLERFAEAFTAQPDDIKVVITL